MNSERELVSLCLSLIGDTDALSRPEAALAGGHCAFDDWATDVDALRAAIRRGEDPLGDAFARLRSPALRRAAGAVYTPKPIVASILDWVADQGEPARVVDPGAGSGRFVLAAGERFGAAELVAVELDPLAALMLRANLAVKGWAGRARIYVADYREVQLPEVQGRTAFVGNPPYVRHHDIDVGWKQWYARRFAELGIRASALAGLHLHFFLQTRFLARPGDIGAFVTSAEWLDVNYGSALRRLLVDELGGVALHVLAPTIEAFPGTATSAAITCFRAGETAAPVLLRAVDAIDGLADLSSGTAVPRRRLLDEPRWSIVVRPSATDLGPAAAAIARDDGVSPSTSEPSPGGDTELGTYFRVHRGQVTGANDIWIDGEHALRLPDRVKLPTVTRAKDLIQAGAALQVPDALRRVIDLPADLDELGADERRSIEAFLVWARSQGADRGYIAKHRRAWWSVGLREPAPILCTYMARRPPQFTLNVCGARHINIAHGLYPRGPVAAGGLDRLVEWLNRTVSTAAGRTYAGGLTKFEPKEIERLRIPTLESLVP